MAAGFYFKGICYASSEEASAAYWSAQPVAVTSGTTSYLTEYVWSAATNVAQIKGYSISSAGGQTLRYTITAPPVTFSGCDTSEGYLDGMALGWGVATAMILVYAVVLAKRGAR